MQSVSICMRLKLFPVVKRVEYPLFMQNANLLSTVNWMPSIHTENITITTLCVLSATYIYTGETQNLNKFSSNSRNVSVYSSRTSLSSICCEGSLIYYPYYYKISPVTFSRGLTDMTIFLQISMYRWNSYSFQKQKVWKDYQTLLE